MEQMTAKACRKELQKIRETIGTVTEEPAVFFRIPGGEYNNEVLRTIYACGSYPVAWSVDSMDWKEYEASELVRRSGTVRFSASMGKEKIPEKW